MSIQIRIEPDVLRASAEQFGNVAKQTEKIKARITDLIPRLDHAWDGGASEQARNALEQMRRAVDQIADGMHSGVSSLNGIAQAFESVDE